MDLSQEKIIFKTSKRRFFWFALFLFIAGGLTVWGMIIINLFFHPQMSYHSQQEFSGSCVFLAGAAYFCTVGKAMVVQQFYVTETGFLRRYGISGKWLRINFDQIAAAAVCTIKSKYGQFRTLTMVCLNHQLLAITGEYTDESVGSIARILANNNIPVYQSIDEARHAAATTGYVVKQPVTAEQLNDPFHVYLHYTITWLPLVIVICLFVGGVLNSHCGTPKNVVVYGTVISTTIIQGKNSSTGEIILRSGKKEELFPVDPQLISHLRIGDQVKAHYTRGCFGLGYDLDCTKLEKRN